LFGLCGLLRQIVHRMPPLTFGLCRSVKTASYENGIVTLRGGACLVGAIAKIAIDCQKIAEIEKQDLEPQRTPIRLPFRKLVVAQGRLRNTEANSHRGDAETRRRSDIGTNGNGKAAADFRRRTQIGKEFSAGMRPALSSESVPGNPILAGSDLGNVKRR